MDIWTPKLTAQSTIPWRLQVFNFHISTLKFMRVASNGHTFEDHATNLLFYKFRSIIPTK